MRFQRLAIYFYVNILTATFSFLIATSASFRQLRSSSIDKHVVRYDHRAINAT